MPYNVLSRLFDSRVVSTLSPENTFCRKFEFANFAIGSSDYFFTSEEISAIIILYKSTSSFFS